jgi:hypothetical protein
MPLSWNEIRHRAIAFSKNWTGVKREQAEKQTFWNEFFEVFGISRRAVASFEEPVRKLSGDYGYIDLFWSGKVLVEHKSAGKNLGKAEAQAFSYIQGLVNEGRTEEVPRYVIVSDFNRIVLPARFSGLRSISLERRTTDNISDVLPIGVEMSGDP